MAGGIHHITLITRKVQANVDFYVGFLGLRLVKQTGGYEDATQLHLLLWRCGGTPGSLITFLVWEDGSPRPRRLRAAQRDFAGHCTGKHWLLVDTRPAIQRLCIRPSHRNSASPCCAFSILMVSS